MKTHLAQRMSLLFLFAVLAANASCGGPQTSDTRMETRPLEENKALEIIQGVLSEKGYKTTFGAAIELSNSVQMPCDFLITGHTIAIEFLTEADAEELSAIPSPASGSRLHVIPARTVTEDAMTAESIYVFIVNARKYQYQYNPTSDYRADVTYREVENRLIRDVKDFLSWYESTRATQN